MTASFLLTISLDDEIGINVICVPADTGDECEYWFARKDLTNLCRLMNPEAPSLAPSSAAVAALGNRPLDDVSRKASSFGIGKGETRLAIGHTAGMIRDRSLPDYLILSGVPKEAAKEQSAILVEGARAARNRWVDIANNLPDVEGTQKDFLISLFRGMELKIREQDKSIRNLSEELRRHKDHIFRAINRIAELERNASRPAGQSSKEVKAAASMLYARAKKLEEQESQSEDFEF